MLLATSSIELLISRTEEAEASDDWSRTSTRSPIVSIDCFMLTTREAVSSTASSWLLVASSIDPKVVSSRFGRPRTRSAMADS